MIRHLAAQGEPPNLAGEPTRQQVQRELFADELPVSAAEGAESRARRVSRAPSGSSPQSKADRHLVAARRLAKAMRRLPDHSVEQTRAGQAICRHLIALLEESDPGGTQRR